jgi:uncharacterized protein (TIGR03000 family)
MRTLVRWGFGAVLVVGLVALAGGPSLLAQDAKKTAKSRIKVTLPQEDAELKIEDKPTKATGKTREFETPPIEVGKEYEYKFTASWRPNNYTVITRNKTVKFKGGEEIVADMTKDDPNDRAVIRYVPTPDDIVAEMIKMAKVTKDDVVFEPGCGDARITIAAVKAGAKKGVGIDLDPERVDESKANVKAAKLEDKIEIRLADALDIKDLDTANVVFLYMGNEFDMLIRPHLWRQLKVGSRVVSHRFTMGDWMPDRTAKIMGADGDEYELHIWTITQEVKDRAAKEAKENKK